MRRAWRRLGAGRPNRRFCIGTSGSASTQYQPGRVDAPTRRGNVRLIVVTFVLMIFRLVVPLIHLGGNDAAVGGIHLDVRRLGVVGHLDAVDEPAILILEFGAAGPAAGMLLGGRNGLYQRDSV